MSPPSRRFCALSPYRANISTNSMTTLLRSASGGWKRLMGFLFPRETDKWLAVLRIGLGLQVAGYAPFLRSDCHYLFDSTVERLVSRELGGAIISFESQLIARVGRLVALDSGH